MFSNRIKSGFLTLNMASQISFYCSSNIKTFFEKFSSLFYRNFHDYFKELLEKIKIIKKFKLFNEYQPPKKQKKNPLIKFFNDMICEKIDYQAKFEKNNNLIKKFQNKIKKENKLEITKSHIPTNILNGLKDTLNPYFKQFRISSKRESKSQFGFKKSSRKKNTKIFKHQNSFLKKMSKKSINIPLIKKNGKISIENTILGFQSTLMDKMMFYEKDKNSYYIEKKLLDGLKIPKCEIDQYFKNRIKQNVPIKFGKDLKKIVDNLQTTNIKSNKLMNNCKSTLKMKKNENLKDDMKFYFHINQNEMKHLDQVKDIIIKHKNSTKIKRNFDVIFENQKEEIKKEDKNNKENFFSKKNNYKWKEIILKRIIKKDKDYSKIGFLKSSITNNKDYNQDVAFIETKEIIKKYMEEIERKSMKQKNNKFKARNFSLRKTSNGMKK